ncbi:MAG: AMP-binding protein [Planctomycetota bacterium]|nr:AMP-binding protein [Planctomycetota bacterium]
MPSSTPGSPLILRDLVVRGASQRRDARVVTWRDGHAHVQTLPHTVERAQGLTRGLANLGVQPGDRVATLMWNDHHHLEAYLAVPCMGAVLHALNLRLPEDDLAWVIEDAGDTIILADQDNLEMAQTLAARCDCQVVAACDCDVEGTVDWETLAATPGDDPWPVLDEETPMGICHTSGTTGRPRGVVYTHRSTCLHTLMISMTDFIGLSCHDRLLGIVPMFHALGWGLPYAACMLGADQVMPGVRPQSSDLLDMIDAEHVTCAAAVATVWSMVMESLKADPKRWDCSSLERIACGGSSASRELRHWYQETLGLRLGRTWGMTELNPVGTFPINQEEGDDSGIALPTLQMKLEDDEGQPVPYDGRSVGHLLVQGPTVVQGYLHDRNEGHFKDGWLVTGDIASLGEHGELTIRDRDKDVIKSGGEWVSSLEVELKIDDVAGVSYCAVVGRPHPTWGERPVAMVVLEPGAQISAENILSGLQSLEKWQRPDDFLFVEALPMTGTGKIDKRAIRSMLDEQAYVLPSLRSST